VSAHPDGLEVRLTHKIHDGLTIDVDFPLGREIGVLFGVSGAGKSTILRLISGLIRPDRGSIRLGGTILFDRSTKSEVAMRQRRIGLIFQDDLLFPHLSVKANVRFGLDRWSIREAEARLAEVSELCGIGGLLDRDPSTLSGGERQRVGLARALAPRPRLLLCDEPVSALDLESRSGIIERIKRVQRAESIPVLYVTHSTDEAITLGDRLFLLDRGRIVSEGSPLDVLSSRASDVSIRLRNTFEAVIEVNPVEALETMVRIVAGPSLVLPRLEGRPGDRLRISIDADEIVLARGEIGAISARNLIDGTVERVVPHGFEAEVVVRTGRVVWMVGVVDSTIEALGLIEGAEVRMIVKSRSCRVFRDEPRNDSASSS
jgi:molybdate transport system ATP-binding protein